MLLKKIYRFLLTKPYIYCIYIYTQYIYGLFKIKKQQKMIVSAGIEVI